MKTEYSVINNITIRWGFDEQKPFISVIGALVLRFVGKKKLEILIKNSVREAMESDMLRQMYEKEVELLKREKRLN